MADVDMTDAPAAGAAADKKKVVKAVDGEKEAKKRFEVKKVSWPACLPACCLASKQQQQQQQQQHLRCFCSWACEALLIGLVID
jgi:hypothetical protein